MTRNVIGSKKNLLKTSSLILNEIPIIGEFNGG